MSDIVGLDLSKFPLDGPLPDVPLTNTQQGRQKVVIEMARSENLTIRQLYKRVATARGHRVALGTAADIADALEEWYRGGAADGFNIMPQVLPAGLNEFVELVVPELQRRGLFRTKYEGRTLRENVGLPRPKNRFVAQRHRSGVKTRVEVALVDDQIVLFDRHRKGLCDVGALHQGLAGFHFDLELPGAGRLRIAPGLAGANLELPAVPRAAQKLLMARQPVMAGSVGLHQRDDLALAQRSALMRAAVGQREIFAVRD